MQFLDFDRLRHAQLTTEPFEYCVVPGFVRPEALARIDRDFPNIRAGGSYPYSTLAYGQAFSQLVDELLSDDVRDAFARLFQMELQGHPTTLTVRGRARHKDGQIHIDSKTKLITVLIYLNRDWSNQGGCLRLLRSEHDIEDVIAEIPPEFGTLVAFRCRPNAWHGHKPFEGVRRTLQLNWVTDVTAARTSEFRHRISSFLKRLRLAG